MKTVFSIRYLLSFFPVANQKQVEQQGAIHTYIISKLNIYKERKIKYLKNNKCILSYRKQLLYLIFVGNIN